METLIYRKWRSPVWVIADFAAIDDQRGEWHMPSGGQAEPFMSQQRNALSLAVSSVPIAKATMKPKPPPWGSFSVGPAIVGDVQEVLTGNDT
ncbi:MAG: hypothetical protein F6J93_11425 [Oscillatoria sp. SIO1A7]|nr:hypothetical protein [Oscillatoria sp. SIO1A7]